MTVPDWWQAAILALASYRLTRLGGWDAFPPVARARAWLIGEHWVPTGEREWNPPCWEPKPQQEGTAEEWQHLVEETVKAGRKIESIGIYIIRPSQFPRPAMQEIGKSADRPPDRPEMPGKQPSSPIEGVRPAYRRPTLAHLVHCPFCLGWWVTLACWASFEAFPHGSLVALSPFALAGAVGLVGKDLDR